VEIPNGTAAVIVWMQNALMKICHWETGKACVLRGRNFDTHKSEDLHECACKLVPRILGRCAAQEVAEKRLSSSNFGEGSFYNAWINTAEKGGEWVKKYFCAADAACDDFYERDVGQI